MISALFRKLRPCDRLLGSAGDQVTAGGADKDRLHLAVDRLHSLFTGYRVSSKKHHAVFSD
jgi:hypothetical protein